MKGIYDLSDDYMNCMLRLWLAMTFYDGHAAVAPHCRSCGQTGSCGNALWPVSDSNHHASSLRCCTRGCTHLVDFCCRIKSHDNLCGLCASRSISDHLGGPGPKASTYIYDCQVKHVDSEGIAFLTEF